jgi:hypothetical protein
MARQSPALLAVHAYAAPHHVTAQSEPLHDVPGSLWHSMPTPATPLGPSPPPSPSAAAAHLCEATLKARQNTSILRHEPIHVRRRPIALLVPRHATAAPPPPAPQPCFSVGCAHLRMIIEARAAESTSRPPALRIVARCAGRRLWDGQRRQALCRCQQLFDLCPDLL